MKKLLGIGLVVVLGVVALILILGRTRGPEEIKIGAILPLTGEAAVYGERTKKGMDFALKEINDELGGIKGKQVQIIYEDDRFDAKEGLNAFNKLVVKDKVPIIVGPLSSGIVLSVAPAANKNKVVILAPYASHYKITEAGDYIFRIYPSDAYQGVIDAELATELGYKNGAILYITTDYGVGLRNVFKKKFIELGGQIISEESFEPEQSDFRTQLTKLKVQNPEFIFMPGNAKEMGRILVQAKELGIECQFISTDAFLEETVVKIAGEAAEDVLFTTLAESKDKIFQRVATKFKETHGEEPGLLESLGYDAVKVVALAIEKGGYNSDKIKNALYNIKDYQGVTGLISFDENGDVVGKTFTIKTIKRGKFIDFRKPTK